MNTACFKFSIAPSNVDQPIGIEVWFNEQKVFDHPQLVESAIVVCEFDNDIEQSHKVRIIVKNKTAEHTKIDDQGNITTDSLITISNFMLDDVEVTQIFHQYAIYNHDFNGSGNQVADSFYGTAGCNGSIELEFTSPAYLWLLENM